LVSVPAVGPDRAHVAENSRLEFRGEQLAAIRVNLDAPSPDHPGSLKAKIKTADASK
jgi:hypothetical protein